MVKRVIATTVFMLMTLVVSAQTVSLNIGPSGYNCGRVTSNTYCYGIPLVVNGTENGTLWIDYNSTTTHFIMFSGAASFLGTAEIVSNTNNGYSFYGTTSSGTAYSGAVVLNYYTYYSSGGGGRGGAGSGYRWVIVPTGSSMLIEYATLQAHPDSPIAPTPTCLPDEGQKTCPDPWKTQ